MRIELESKIDENELPIINHIVGVVSENDNLDKVFEKMKMLNIMNNINKNSGGVKFGRGGSHIWVSNTEGKRILKIVK